ncbi:hypothetical protein BV25DRAFT_91451 [Artomyces pyxidatus]|uniref:Uncharacterized protein n=1 Tax=Artomyces pyxidatus TaxID=48021 RepID=A0ACB8TKS9_9AGAM|nr:hypothetical protein BV25DRAFT_91451 [Artomyces pyxidatus]
MNKMYGVKILLGGIVFQLGTTLLVMSWEDVPTLSRGTVSIVTCSALESQFLTRYIMDKPVYHTDLFAKRSHATDTSLKLLLLGISFMTVCIFIRSVYRTVELSDGWYGKFDRTEVYFSVLDAAMIILAMFTLNVLHPGFLLGNGEASAVETITTACDLEQRNKSVVYSAETEELKARL